MRVVIPEPVEYLLERLDEVLILNVNIHHRTLPPSLSLRTAGSLNNLDGYFVEVHIDITQFRRQYTADN